MGQYHKVVCPSRAEWIDNYKIGSGLKAWEQVFGYTGQALALLIAAEPGNSPGDLASPVTGRWAGEPIAMLGDYAEDHDAIPGWKWEPVGEVYGLCVREREEDCRPTYRMADKTPEQMKAENEAEYDARVAAIIAAGHRTFDEPFGRELQGMLEYAQNVRFCGSGWLTAVPVRTVATARHAGDAKATEVRVCTKGWTHGRDDKYEFETRTEMVGVYELRGYRTLAYYARCGIKVDDWHRPPRSGHWHGLRDADVEEGQERLIVNLDRREFIDPAAFGEPNTLAGIVSAEPGGSASMMLAMLLFNQSRGGGDIDDDEVGRWQGNRLLVSAERSIDGGFPTTDEVRKSFRNISYEATALAGRLRG